MNFDTAISYAGGATLLGIGTSSNPSNILASSTALTKNTLSYGWPSAGGSGTDNSTGTTGLQLAITACSSANTAGGTATGTVRILIMYERFSPLMPHP
jgi:hypothetical protein